MAKHKGGRPTDMTIETVNKLEEVFSIGGTDKEACFYAGISHQTLYNYQDRHPEFVERKEALKERPVLKARQTLVKALDTPQYALEYLKRKRKDEFGDNQKHEVDFSFILEDGNKQDTLGEVVETVVKLPAQAIGSRAGS